MIKNKNGDFFSIFRNMLLNIGSISNVILYSASLIPEKKNQIDNVDIMNAICEIMFLLNYSFITSRILMCLFLETCV